MEIRHYRAADEQAAIALWNECLPQDTLDRENFYKRIVYDLNFDPKMYLLAYEGEVLSGFIYVVRRIIPDEITGLEPETGWVVAMGTKPCSRRKGIGGALLTAAEKLLKDCGIKKVFIGAYATNYICPGVDVKAYESGVEFLKANGYTVSSTCCSMDIDLHGFVYPERYAVKKKKLEDEGYRFKSFAPEDSISLFEFMRESFPWWLPQVRDLILSGMAERSMIIAQNKDGKTEGFVMRSMDGTEERFGPFGVKADSQGTGLGSVLFNELMRQMVSQRIYHTYFLWTGGRNLDIYATWGMKIYRTYAMMSKAL